MLLLRPSSKAIGEAGTRGCKLEILSFQNLQLLFAAPTVARPLGAIVSKISYVPQ